VVVREERLDFMRAMKALDLNVAEDGGAIRRIDKVKAARARWARQRGAL
jgi:hypothetical protein